MCFSQYAGVSLSLRGTTYSNNSVVSITDIGEGDDALLCQTNNTQCCRARDNPNRVGFGQWFFPNGDEVMHVNDGAGDFYRNRHVSIVRLNRRNDALSPTGCYRCKLLDASGVNQTIYVNIGELTINKNTLKMRYDIGMAKA